MFLIQIIFINFMKIVQIVRTFRIYTFVYNKMFTLFFWNKCVWAIRASKNKRFYVAIVFGRKLCITHLATKLAFRTVILVKINFWCIATGTFTVVADVTFRTTLNWFDFLVVAPFEVRNEIFVIPRILVDDFWKLIYFEFLIFRWMGIVKSPLFKWDVSANKIEKLTNNFRLVLNVLK